MDDNNINVNNALKFLKDITSVSQPLFYKSNIEGMNIITNYLDKLGLKYTIHKLYSL